MKKIGAILPAIFIMASVWAQSPQKMSYQAIIRNGNELVKSSQIGMKISILKDDVSVYSETQTPTTNVNGLVSIEIGTGITGDNFASIDWANGTYFIQTETDVDPAGGLTDYTITGTSQLLSVPYALHAKTVESVDISKVTGILGSQVVNNFPDIINNKVSIEISGIQVNDKVIIVSPVGHQTERISSPVGFDSQGKIRYWEEAGLTMEFPLIFETDNIDDINALKAWYEEYPPSARDIAIIIKDLAGTESGRWIFYSYKPVDYETASNNRFRFSMQASASANTVLECEYDGEFGTFMSFNPQTDKVVEISGVDLGYTYRAAPAFEIDTVNRTMTLTFDYLEGYQLYNWVQKIVKGLDAAKPMSVIETTDGINEFFRMNYFNCIPIRYEHFTGFGLNTKLKARVVLAYGFSEIAK
jgi:hypothetical protein